MSSSSAVSLPPHSIRVKRQRTEEPVVALYIENAKRRRLSKEFVFRLARTVDSPAGDREVPPSPKKLVSPVQQTESSTSKDAIASPVSDAMSISPTLPSKTAAAPVVKVEGGGSSSRLQRPQTPTPMVTTANDGKGKSMDPDLLSPGTKTEIRRFHLSKRVKLDPYGHGGGAAGGAAGGGVSGSTKKRDRNVISVFMEGSGRVAKKRSLGRLEYVKGGREAAAAAAGETSTSATGTPKIKLTGADDDRRKPKTHPMEKVMIEQRKSREHSRSRENDATAAAAAGTGTGSAYYTPQEHKDDWALETDELTQQLQAMVMDYIANQPGIENLTPTSPGAPYPAVAGRKKRPSPSSSVRVKKEVVSGDIGPARAIDTDHTKLSMDAAASAAMDAGSTTGAALDTTVDGLALEDTEGDWVYDVYVREELKPEVNESGELVRADEEYGVLVISNSDDEEWWYDQDDEDSDSKAFGSDDEDSNAEDYHTNDYPDEDDDDTEPEYDDEEGPRFRGLTTKGGRKITTADDEEYDLNDYADDESDGDEREGRMMW